MIDDDTKKQRITFQRIYNVIENHLQTELLYFLLHWEREYGESFFAPNKTLQKYLWMSMAELKYAKAMLKEKGILEVTRSGYPAKSKYKILDKIIKADFKQNNPVGGTEKISSSNPSSESELKGNPNFLNNIPVGGSHLSSDIYNYSNNIKGNKGSVRGKKGKEHSVPPTKKLSKQERLEQKYPEVSIEFGLSKILMGRIIDRAPTYFGKSFTEKQKMNRLYQWSEHVDRLIRIDGRKKEDVLEVILWCQDNNFWCNNICSTDKLRKQFMRLFLEMNQCRATENTVHPSRDRYPKITEKIIELYQDKFLSGKKVNWEPRDYTKFMQASIQLIKFASATRVPEKNLPKHLINCLYDKYILDEEKVVTPGFMCTSRTWDVLMPHYLRDLGINFKKNRKKHT